MNLTVIIVIIVVVVLVVLAALQFRKRTRAAKAYRHERKAAILRERAEAEEASARKLGAKD